MLNTNLPSIQLILEIVASRIARSKRDVVVDVDAEINRLQRVVSDLPFKRTDMREELARLLTDRGVTVRMAG